MAKHLLISVADLKRKKRFTQWVGREEVMAIETPEGIRVYSAMCPHQGGPLGEGTLAGNTLTCPWHGCRFEVSDGACTDIGACRNVSGMKLKPLSFHIDADSVYVELP